MKRAATRTLAGIPVPDTPLVAKAIDYAQRESEPYLFNHVMRSWLFATRIGQLKKIDHDAEVVALGTILHDITLNERFKGPRRFEVEGADIVRNFARQGGVDERRAQLIWDSVALNSTPSIGLYKESEVALCTAGICLDVVGMEYNLIPPADMVAILQPFPRLDVKRRIARCFEKAILAGYDWGARTANIVAALWPERCKAMVSVSGYLIGSQAANAAPLPPPAELQWWYQFYFATERGRAGYAKYTADFARLIWQIASPSWSFDDAIFARSAAAFQNADHVAITIHNYRWRLGLAEGESQYDELEKKLAAGPLIDVPTITLEGDANGAPHPDPAVYAKKFSGKYEHRLVTGGIGHNLPQEAPEAFAKAVIDVAGLDRGD